jgi:Zn-dependent peptidase ImmA (M78 family)
VRLGSAIPRAPRCVARGPLLDRVLGGLRRPVYRSAGRPPSPGATAPRILEVVTGPSHGDTPVRRREAAEDAEQTRSLYWGDSLPVDPVRIAKSFGLRVMTARLPDDRSGALVKAREEAPTILLNSADAPKRQRFTCAHELGHYVKRTDHPAEYEYIDYRDALASQGRDPEEIYANQFAASLLMPAADVRRLAGDGLSDLQMSHRFDVSLEAMQYRLQKLGIQ